MSLDLPQWIVVAAVQLGLVAAAWGDLRRQVMSDRERHDERHAENKATLAEISLDVKRINGTVREHDVELADHEREIDRLRRNDR